MRPVNMFFALAGFAALGACDVDQTKEGSLPDVDVNASGGSLPEYDIQGPEVNVGTTEQQITVPEVKTEKKTVEVPTIDVDTPND